MLVESVSPRWQHCHACVVAATGPALTEEVAATCKAAFGVPVLAVNDAWRLMPWADALYACDAAWWNEYDGVPQFNGEKWSSHNPVKDEKLACAAKWGLRLIAGQRYPGFSFDPCRIHYGDNSGFQAINLAIHFGAKKILLVGFNMHGGHFFGRHPKELRNVDPKVFIPRFETAAKLLKGRATIVNCTPNSALTCFPQQELTAALQK